MPKDMKDLKKKLSLVSSYVDTVQLDLMDGKFVADSTWLFDPIHDKPSLDEIKELKKIK